MEHYEQSMKQKVAELRNSSSGTLKGSFDELHPLVSVYYNKHYNTSFKGDENRVRAKHVLSKKKEMGGARPFLPLRYLQMCSSSLLCSVNRCFIFLRFDTHVYRPSQRPYFVKQTSTSTST